MKLNPSMDKFVNSKKKKEKKVGGGCLYIYAPVQAKLTAESIGGSTMDSTEI